MAHGPHPPQHASEDSVVEVPLHQLVDPAFSSSNASGSHRGSVYGGVAPSTHFNDYHDPYIAPSRPSHDSYDHSSPARTSNDNERRNSQQHQQHQHYEYEQHHQQAGYPDYPPIAASRSLSPSHTGSARDSNALPAFSRWSPTWQSGGYSGDGKGYTTHRPPPSALEVEPHDFPPPHHYPHRAGSDDAPPHVDDTDDEDGKGGWVSEAPIRSEWQGAGGEYRHGVGYDSQKGSSGKWSEAKIAGRIKKLEKEFGMKGGGGAGEGPNLSMKARIRAAKEDRRREKVEMKERSGVDGKGRLVVLGAKKRAALRWAQGLGAVVVGAASIGASLLTKPITDPPPKGSIPIYLLYLLPFVSLALTLYLFAIRPCLQARRAAATGSSPPNHFVVPLVQAGPGHPNGGPGGSCCCFGSRKDPRRPRGPGGKHYQPGTTVNLLVDPSNFHTLFQQQPTPLTESAREKEKRRKQRRRRRKRQKQLEKDADRDDEGEEGLISSSSTSTSSSDSESSDAWSVGEGPRSNQRKGILSAVALEGRWREARSWLRKVAWWDAGAAFLWLAVGAYAVGWGERCTPGGYQGFCNFYNTSLAFAILLAVAFLVSLTFDILDLRRTRAPPRLRQRV